MHLFDPDWIVSAENVDPGFDDPYCHATTIVENEGGLALSFFGGNGDARQDLWFMRRDGGGWHPAERIFATERRQDACWNPVLQRLPSGELLCFYKQGPSPSLWAGAVARSEDGGRTWSTPSPLPDGIWGPILNKALPLPDGRLLCGSSTEHDGWRVHFETTPDGGQTWTSTGPLADPEGFGAIQPTLLRWPSSRIQALCRTKSSVIVETWSEDDGATWSPLARAGLPNPNAGIDAVLMPDGRALLIYNPTRNEDGFMHERRTPLSVAVSDDAANWELVGHLETDDDEFSYPAVIVNSDGLVHVTYTTGRRWTGMRHVVIDPERLP